MKRLRGTRETPMSPEAIALQNSPADIPELRHFRAGLVGAELLAQSEASCFGTGPGDPGVARSGKPAASPSESQARHLSLSGGRTIAPGDARLQAKARQNARPADARVLHQGPAAGPAAGRETDLLRTAVRVQESLASRGSSSASCFHTSAASRMTFALFARCGRSKLTTIRPIP